MTSLSLISKSNRLLLAGSLLFVCSLSTSAAEKIQRQVVSPGLEYLHKTVPEVPWSIYVLKVARDQQELGLVTTLPNGNLLGLTKLSEQIPCIPKRVGKGIGGINGDFFSWRKGPYQGDPAGVQIMNGELVSGPYVWKPDERGIPQGAAAFWIDADGDARIGIMKSEFEIHLPDGMRIPFRLNAERTDDEAMLYTHIAGTSTRTTNGVELLLTRDGFRRWLPLRASEHLTARIAAIGTTNTALSTNVLVLSLGPELIKRLPQLKTGMKIGISTATNPDLKNSPTAMGGGPILVESGKAIKSKDPQRHPRTAVGFNDTHYFLVVVDGRRPGVSEGMTTAELAKEMARLGCTEAMNLDGGGSAMLWLNGELKNQPSDNRGERPNANSLIVVHKTPPSMAPGRQPMRGAELLLNRGSR